MRNLEIITKDVTKAKLTITNNRITLKLPASLSEDECSKFRILTNKINLELPEQELTLRGRFYEHGIYLTPETSDPTIRMKFSKTFKYD